MDDSKLGKVNPVGWHVCLSCQERTAVIGAEKLPTTCPYCRKRWRGMTEDLYNTLHNVPAAQRA